jgi:hypothetical protein
MPVDPFRDKGLGKASLVATTTFKAPLKELLLESPSNSYRASNPVWRYRARLVTAK